MAATLLEAVDDWARGHVQRWRETGRGDAATRRGGYWREKRPPAVKKGKKSDIGTFLHGAMISDGPSQYGGGTGAIWSVSSLPPPPPYISSLLSHKKLICGLYYYIDSCVSTGWTSVIEKSYSRVWVRLLSHISNCDIRKK